MYDKGEGIERIVHKAIQYYTIAAGKDILVQHIIWDCVYVMVKITRIIR